MADRIRVGVMTHPDGAHLSAYLEALHTVDEAAEVAVADPTGRLEDSCKQALGDKFSGFYRDRDAMLREFKPALALVTMEAAQAPPAIDAALNAGCQVLAEKPACIRAEDFAPLVHKAESKHLEVMLALANRIHASAVEARRLFSEGRLGRLYGVEIHLIADQTRLRSPAYHQSWFAHKDRAGGGHLIWLGIHWLDLAQYITGQAIAETAGFTTVVGGQPLDVEDSAAMALKFAEGALGTMTSGYYLDRGYHSHLQIWGEDGWLRLAMIEDQPLEWYSRKGADSPKIERFEYPKGGRSYTPFVRACVRFAAGLGPAPITSQESLQALKAVFACYRAAASGRSQRVE